MELFTTIGMVIAFTIPVIMLFFSLTNAGYDSSAKSQAAAISRTIADNINEVYAQGEEAQRELLLNMPSSTDSLRIIGNDNVEGGEVVVKLTVSGKTFESASPVFAKVETFESRDSDDPSGPPRGPYRLKVIAKKNAADQVEVRIYELIR